MFFHRYKKFGTLRIISLLEKLHLFRRVIPFDKLPRYFHVVFISSVKSDSSYHYRVKYLREQYRVQKVSFFLSEEKGMTKLKFSFSSYFFSLFYFCFHLMEGEGIFLLPHSNAPLLLSIIITDHLSNLKKYTYFYNHIFHILEICSGCSNYMRHLKKFSKFRECQKFTSGAHALLDSNTCRPRFFLSAA